MSSISTDDLLSIGEVASATGISTDTIRVWERRYGKPNPIRLPSGHRRYTVEQMHWLRRVAEALKNGARPSKVVRGGESELEKYLKVEEEPQPELISDEELDSYLGQIRAYRESELLERLWAEWNAFGPSHFVLKRLAPLVRRVRDEMDLGDLNVRHERFVVDLVEYFLRAARLGVRVDPQGPLMVLATLEGDARLLELHMAATVCTIEGGRVQIVGANAPLEEIVAAADGANARAVAMSASPDRGGLENGHELVQLGAMLEGRLLLVLGEAADPRGLDGVECVGDLEQFATWVRDWTKSGERA